MSVVTASSPTCREETIVLYPKNTITFAETIQTSSSAFTATVFIRRSVTVLSFNEQNSRHSYDGLGRMTDGPVSYDLNGSITSIGSLPSHTFYEGRDEDIFYTYLADGTLLVSDKSDDSDVHVYAGYLNFGARFYDPKTGFFLSPDPKEEQYFGINPYLYCGGDPVNLVDVNGLSYTDARFQNLCKT